MDNWDMTSADAEGMENRKVYGFLFWEISIWTPWKKFDPLKNVGPL